MALVDDPGVHRFTVSEFLQLASTMDAKVELIDGVIYDVGEESADHIRIVMFVLQELVRARPQCETLPGGTVRLEPRGAPIPDVAVYRANADTSSRYFQSADLLLVVEVSLTTTSPDRAKLGDYARAGVPEVWIIERVVPGGTRLRVTVYTSPDVEGGVFLDHHSFTAAHINRLEPELYIATF